MYATIRYDNQVLEWTWHYTYLFILFIYLWGNLFSPRLIYNKALNQYKETHKIKHMYRQSNEINTNK